MPALMWTTVPPGKIEGAKLLEPSADAPHPVRNRIVNKGSPEDDKEQEARELHPLRKSPDHQGGRDDGEHGLEDHERLMGDRRRVILEGLEAYARKPEPAQAAPKPLAGRKGKAVTEKHPLNADHAEHRKALHQYAEHVLAPDHAAVKKGKAGRHEHDQGGRCEDPCRIACVHKTSFIEIKAPLTVFSEQGRLRPADNKKMALSPENAIVSNTSTCFAHAIGRT